MYQLCVMCVLCEHKKYSIQVFFPANVDTEVVIELEQVNYPVEEDMEEVEVCAVLVNGELNCHHDEHRPAGHR